MDCATQEEAVAHYRRATEVFDKRFGTFNPRTVTLLGKICNCYLRLDRTPEAVPVARMVAEAAFSRYPENTLGRAMNKGKLARILVQAGEDLTLGERFADEAVAGIIARDPVSSADWGVYFAAVRGQALRKMGRASEAITLLNSQVDANQSRRNPAWAYAFLYNEWAECLAIIGDTDGARASSKIAVESAAELAGPLGECHPVKREVDATARKLGVVRNHTQTQQ
jgi:hypothetical protein